MNKKAIKKGDCRTLLPSNCTNLEYHIEQITGKRINNIEKPIFANHQIEQADTEVLPFLALNRSVDNWQSNWDEETKRKIIKASFKVHQHKGTLGSIKDALAPIRTRISVIESDEANHTFKVFVFVGEEQTKIKVSKNTFKKVREIINSTKPVRSHYSLSVAALFGNKIGIANKFTSASIFATDCEMTTENKKNKTSLGFQSTATVVAVAKASFQFTKKEHNEAS